MCKRWVRLGRTDDACNWSQSSGNVIFMEMGSSNATCTNREMVDACKETWAVTKTNIQGANSVVGVCVANFARRSQHIVLYPRKAVRLRRNDLVVKSIVES